LATEALADLKNVETTSFSGLTIDFARQVGAKVIVRGIRGVSDFEVEMQMALINRKMAPDVESVYMMPSLDYSFISATLIKEISKLGGPVSQLVPEHVATALRNKFRANE
jgi:pantetheine-phosphate adenylyltransferase